MLDISYLFVVLLFFAVAIRYVHVLEKLRGGDHE